MTLRELLLLVSSVVVGACGTPAEPSTDAGPAPDAGADADSGIGVDLDPPTPPALPRLVCPEGWRSIPDDAAAPGLTHCSPWPDSGPAPDCADHEAHFPGTPGCEVVGTACGDDDWATDLPDARDIVYVRAGAVGGNGLRSNPFGSVQRAIDSVGDDGIVAVSKGTFDEALVVTRPLTVWGACPAETVLTSSLVLPPEDLGAVVEVFQHGATFRNLRVDADHIGFDVFAVDGPLVLDSVIVRGLDAGILVDDGGQLEARELVVRDVAPGFDGTAGYGIGILDGGRAVVERAAIERTHAAGLSVLGIGADLRASDVVVRDVIEDQASLRDGTGVQVWFGGHAALERVAIERGHTASVFASGEGTSVELTDVLAHGVAVAEGGGASWGVYAEGGARVTGSRIEIDGAQGIGVRSADRGTSIDLADVFVHDCFESGIDPAYADGMGLLAGLQAEATLRRAVLARNHQAGVQVSDGSSFEAEDLSIAETLPAESDGRRGFGLLISLGSTATIERVVARGNHEIAILVRDEGTRATMADVRVEDSAATAATTGSALLVDGAAVDLQRAALVRSITWALAVVHGSITASDLSIDGVGEDEGVAGGAIGGEGGNLTVHRFEIASSDVCGVMVLDGSGVDLADGLVHHNAIGANVQDPGFDLSRIQDQVDYVDNDVNLDATSLPLPDFE